jgi:hypothetical protein
MTGGRGGDRDRQRPCDLKSILRIHPSRSVITGRFWGWPFLAPAFFLLRQRRTFSFRTTRAAFRRGRGFPLTITIYPWGYFCDTVGRCDITALTYR